MKKWIFLAMMVACGLSINVYSNSKVSKFFKIILGKNMEKINIKVIVSNEAKLEKDLFAYKELKHPFYIDKNIYSTNQAEKIMKLELVSALKNQLIESDSGLEIRKTIYLLNHFDSGLVNKDSYLYKEISQIINPKIMQDLKSVYTSSDHLNLNLIQDRLISDIIYNLLFVQLEISSGDFFILKERDIFISLFNDLPENEIKNMLLVFKKDNPMLVDYSKRNNLQNSPENFLRERISEVTAQSIFNISYLFYEESFSYSTAALNSVLAVINTIKENLFQKLTHLSAKESHFEDWIKNSKSKLAEKVRTLNHH